MTSLFLAGGRLHLREVTGGHGRLLVLALAVLVVVVAAVVVVTVVVRNQRRRSRLELPEEPRGDDPTPPAVAIHVDHLSKVYRLGRTAGTVLIHGREVTCLPEGDRAVLRLGGLGYVFQEYALLPELTALENVRLPALMLGRGGEDDRARAAHLLRLVGLGNRICHRPRELSGGEQQRVAIARAIVNHPRVVFADEPTANLDSQSAATVMETLRELNWRLHVTIVFVSHDADDARYATRVVRLADGKLVGAAA
jgi:putative ABC transport system ATP-binding protein